LRQITIPIGYVIDVVTPKLDTKTMVVNDKTRMVITPYRQQRDGDSGKHDFAVVIEHYVAHEPMSLSLPPLWSLLHAPRLADHSETRSPPLP